MPYDIIASFVPPILRRFAKAQPRVRVSLVCDVLKDIPDGHFEVSISTRDGTHVTYATTMDGARRWSLSLRTGTQAVHAQVGHEGVGHSY